MRPRRRFRDACPPLVLAALLALLTPHLAQARRPPDPREAAALDLADSLFRAWRTDSALVLLDSLVARPRGPVDRNFLMEIQLRRAAGLGLTGRPVPSEAAAQAAIRMATALGDSAVQRTALRWLGYSYLTRMRLEESSAIYTRLLTLAVPAGDSRNEGFARTALAYADLTGGRLEASRDEYRRAVACMKRAGDTRAMLTPLVGLARAQAALGEFAGARRSYEEIVDMAGRLDARTLQADAINNLGTIEYQVGDPAQAVRWWRRAVDIYRTLGATESLRKSATNVAMGEADLGHFDEAVRRLDELLAQDVEREDKEGQIHVLLQLASIHSAQGRPAEAIALLRRCLELRGGIAPGFRVEALLRISSAMGAMDRAAEGLDLLVREAQPLRARLPVDAIVGLDLQMGSLMRSAGSPGVARAAFVRAERSAQASGLARDRLAATIGAGRCEWELGHSDSARAVLRRAALLWEAERSVPTDPEWRSRRGELGEELCLALGRTLLPPRPGVQDSAAVAEAYDVLQRFKTRTLLERMAGPAGSLRQGRPPVTLAELQNRVLAEGQLLLDMFVGREDALLFAVTRHEVRLVHWPAGDSLSVAVQLYRELVATPPGKAEDPARSDVRRRAARSLSRMLLGQVADLVSHSRRVIVAPDGPLNGIALGELPLEAGGSPAEAALLEHREVIRVPSATVLAESRAATPTERSVLALGGTTDAAGRSLPGAVDEVRALGRAYEGTDVRVFGAGQSEVFRAGDLDRYQVLHFAAHVTVDDQRPWNSRLLLAPDADTTTGARVPPGMASDSNAVVPDPWLDASAIASMQLPADLAVLSGCESGGGRIAWGEGVQGLGAAFISAGVRAVVVTLWPVDDRVSATVMREFYSGLARGETAAAALRGAQLRVARRSPTRNPFYWAGYVLVGDGNARVALRRRFPAGEALATALLALAMLVAGIGWRRRSVHRSESRGAA